MSDTEPILRNAELQQHSEISSINAASQQIDEPGAVIRAQPVTVYSRRWYILLLFSSLGFLQNFIAVSWSPIAKPAQRVFGWSQTQFALLVLWQPAVYCLTFAAVLWLIFKWGVRCGAVISALAMALATGVRCLSMTPDTQTWLSNVGAILDALAGPLTLAGPPLLSSVWFPAGERTIATAVVCAVGGAGVTASFLLAPAAVPDTGAHGNTPDVNAERQNIQTLLYAQFISAAIIYLLVVIYFPSKPPRPPSSSATEMRLDIVDGIKTLIQNREFRMVCLCYTCSIGMFFSLSSELDVVLDPLGISQSEAQWLGFYSTAIGQGLTIVVARILDYFSKRLKSWIICLYIIATLSGFTFALVCVKVVHMSQAITTALLYTSYILSSCCICTSIPLYLELCVEITYPVDEFVTGVTIYLFTNSYVLLVMVILMVKSLGTAWMTWLFVASSGVVSLIMYKVTVVYRRNNMDVPPNAASIFT